MTPTTFDPQPGDLIRVYTKTGFAVAVLERVDRKGRYHCILQGRRRSKKFDDVFPVNDGKRVRERGFVIKNSYNSEAPKKRGRKR